MHRKGLIIAHLIIVAIAFYLISYTYNTWFSVTMPRHQLLQLPAMLLIGISLGYQFRSKIKLNLAWGISVVIFFMASIIFWMLPHSVDAAVISAGFNRVMHLNMIAAGFLIVIALNHLVFEVKMLFFAMLSAKLLASGITLSVFDILLCSAFTIAQQKQTGTYLIIIAITMVVFTLFRYLSFPDNKS